MSLIRQKNPKAIFSATLDKFLDYDAAGKEFNIRFLDGDGTEKHRDSPPMSLSKGLITFSKRAAMTDEDFINEFKKRFMFVTAKYRYPKPNKNKEKDDKNQKIEYSTDYNNQVRIIAFEDSIDAIWQIKTDRKTHKSRLELVSAYNPFKKCFPSKIEAGYWPDGHFFYDLAPLNDSETLRKLVRQIERIKSNGHHEMNLAKRQGAQLSE